MADNSDKPKSSTPDTKAPAQSEKAVTVSATEKSGATRASASKGADNLVKPGKTSSVKSSGQPIKQKDTPPRSKAKTGLLWFAVVLNFILLAFALGAAYWGWAQWQQLQGSQNEYIESQQSKLAQQAESNLALTDNIEQQNRELQRTVKQMSGQLQSALEQAQSAGEQASANKQMLSTIAGRRPADWLLAEADFLIRMAGRKLWLEHDVKTAVMMLQSADSRLQDLDDPSLLPIRERLAKDLQGLQQINPVSLSSLALSLGALLQQVNNLPLDTFERPTISQEEAKVSDSVDDWQTNLARNWDAFTADFFSFKKKETDIQPYMSQEQQWLAREQLKLTLLQAQGAVLKEDVKLYQQALHNALAVLAEDFNNQSTKVTQFNDRLKDLLDTDIDRVYPDQFSVAPALQDLIQDRLDKVFSNGNAMP